ncbi:ABC transporter permease subunit [Variovorax sp. NFACC27]|uniref:ABC transporter permease subunit n=1 Tax=unclassified Variovorax TaxID=663243 RepID=UPI000895307E|nr:polar amino acid transport system permease protein [Variovorax sp. NFACC28]SEG98132.1 polar amino acid transport system permease protein [Variovorax sp. NFACC29]SFE04842.1 polar amino acid transport system permease protein [Variovorax sp. NFACC26]SFH12930.1 polar amino acid transport system permease protein [Variovorax sp. NFACC27]
MELHGFGGQLWLGMWTTLRLAGAALLLGLVFGALGCRLQLSPNRWMAALGRGYVAVVRGVPDLLLILFVYFGGLQLWRAVSDRPVDVPAFAAATVALALSFGAFASEVFRGALQAVARTQREAATVLGLRPAAAFLTVVAPQALRAGLAPCGNQAIVLLKQTSLASVIGCDELMRKAAETFLYGDKSMPPSPASAVSGKQAISAIVARPSSKKSRLAR